MLEPKKKRSLPEEETDVRYVTTIAPLSCMPYYGTEELIHVPPVLEWVLVQAEVLKRLHSSGRKPLAIDFGGGCGRTAMRLAEKGFDALVIDFAGAQGEAERRKLQDIVDTRNERLSENPANGKIRLFLCDARDVDAKKLKELCEGRKPSIITALNFIHYLKFPDVEKFVKLVSDAGPEVFALSFETHENPKNTVGHSPDDVESIICGRGFEKTVGESKPAATSSGAMKTEIGFCRNFKPKMTRYLKGLFR